MGEYSNWNEWGKYVIKKLEEHDDKFGKLDKSVIDLKEHINTQIASLKKTIAEDNIETAKDIVVLKVKAGVWGLLAGAIPVALMILINALSK